MILKYNFFPGILEIQLFSFIFREMCEKPKDVPPTKYSKLESLINTVIVSRDFYVY